MKTPEHYVIHTLPAILSFVMKVVFGWQSKEWGHQLLMKVSLNHEVWRKMIRSNPHIFVTGQAAHQYVSHKTLSGEQIKTKKLKQHSETNNSGLANKTRDVSFKEDLKQGDVSVLNSTALHSNCCLFLIKSHTFRHSYRWCEQQRWGWSFKNVRICLLRLWGQNKFGLCSSIKRLHWWVQLRTFLCYWWFYECESHVCVQTIWGICSHRSHYMAGWYRDLKL